MSTTQQDKPGGKHRKRNRKAGQPDQKSEPQQSPMPDRQEEDQIDPMVAVASVPADVVAMPAENDPISLQTIANAYGDYTRRSLLESGSFVEKLMAVRSLDKAFEVQTEFTRQAYANFLAESQKICELYRELARQTFKPWGFAAGMTETRPAAWPAVSSQSQH